MTDKYLDIKSEFEKKSVDGYPIQIPGCSGDIKYYEGKARDDNRANDVSTKQFGKLHTVITIIKNGSSISSASLITIDKSNVKTTDQTTEYDISLSVRHGHIDDMDKNIRSSNMLVTFSFYETGILIDSGQCSVLHDLFEYNTEADLWIIKVKGRCVFYNSIE